MSDQPALPRRVDRRTALKWVLTASSGLMLSRGSAAAQVSPPPTGAAAPIDPLPARPGYGTDPDLVKAYSIGDYWPLTLTPAQRESVAALSDWIIPADEGSPSASAVGVVDFIDEWISAPYPEQAGDRVTVLGGLRWLDEEAGRRGAAAFVQLGERSQREICDAICGPGRATAELAPAAKFFETFRGLTLAGFYTSPDGMRDVGYVGNLPSLTYAGPPPEVLQRLGIPTSA